MQKTVGMRYVPVFEGEWDINKSYEALSVVQFQGNSYTSKCPVATGIDITNTSCWICSGNYNAQIEQYRQQLVQLSKDAVENYIDVSKIEGIDIEGNKDCSTIINALIANNTSFYFPSNVIIKANIEVKNVKNVHFFGEGVLYGGIAFRNDMDFTTGVYNSQSSVKGLHIYAREGSSDFCISLSKAWEVYIEGCYLASAEFGIYFKTNEMFQNNRQIYITNNKFNMIDYSIYGFDGDFNTWVNADIHVIANQFLSIRKSAIKMHLIDGLIFSNNTLFGVYNDSGTKYSSEALINLQASNWTHIANNNIFEGGKESIYCTNYYNLQINNNHISYGGHDSLSSAIYLQTENTDISNRSVALINSNNILNATKHGIEIADVANTTGMYTITGNYVFGLTTGPTDYRGPALTSITHFGIYSPNVSYSVITSNNTPENAMLIPNDPNVLRTSTIRDNLTNVDAENYNIKRYLDINTFADSTTGLIDLHASDIITLYSNMSATNIKSVKGTDFRVGRELVIVNKGGAITFENGSNTTDSTGFSVGDTPLVTEYGKAYKFIYTGEKFILLQ